MYARRRVFSSRSYTPLQSGKFSNLATLGMKTFFNERYINKRVSEFYSCMMYRKS